MPKRTETNPLKAVLYVRVSTDEQGLGPEAQREAAQRWAASRGVEIVAVHEDRGVSGGAALDACPGLLAALSSITAYGAGVLLVAKRDRLARDVMKAAMIESLVAGRGATVESAAGEGEGADPASLLMRRMVDAFAEYERALIRSRTKAALAVKKSRGERTGRVPYGKRLAADGVHLEDDPVEQAVLAEIAALRSSGLTLRAMGVALNRRGVVLRGVSNWSHPQKVRNALAACG